MSMFRAASRWLKRNIPKEITSDSAKGFASKAWEAAGASEYWRKGVSLTDAWDLKKHGSAHLKRAAGGAIAGAAMNMGIYGATALGASALSVIPGVNQMVENRGSFTGFLGAGMKGAVMGGIAGGAAVRKGFSTKSALPTYSLRPSFSRALNMTGAAGAAIAPGAMQKGLDRIGASSIRKTMSRGARPVMRADGIRGRAKAAGKRIKSNMRKSTNQGESYSRMKSGLVLGGLAYSAFSSNAMGLSVPSNYGYR